MQDAFVRLAGEKSDLGSGRKYIRIGPEPNMDLRREERQGLRADDLRRVAPRRRWNTKGTKSYRSHWKSISDGYRDGVVFEEAAVQGRAPNPGWILKSTSFVTGPELDRVAPGFARILIPGERLLDAA